MNLPARSSPSDFACGPLPPGLWRADQLEGHGQPVVASGHAALDAELPGGGWPLHALTELLLPRAGIGEWRLLAPALRRATQGGRSLVLISPPHLPYGPALQAQGLPLAQMLLVRAEPTEDRLWTIEQTLKSASFGALLAWLPQARPEQLRRLQLAAQAANGLVFVVRPLPARHESSPAPLRLICQAARDVRPGAVMRMLAVQILKRRGPVLETPVLLDLPQPLAAARTVRARPPVAKTNPQPFGLPSSVRPGPTPPPNPAPCQDQPPVTHPAPHPGLHAVLLASPTEPTRQPAPALARIGGAKPPLPVIADVLDRARFPASAA